MITRKYEASTDRAEVGSNETNTCLIEVPRSRLVGILGW